MSDNLISAALENGVDFEIADSTEENLEKQIKQINNGLEIIK